MTSPLRDDDALLPHPNPDAVFAEVSEGAVLYLPAAERYFGLTPVAVQVWQMLPPVARTMGEICRGLAERYPDVPMDILRADVSELLEALARMQLVTAPATV